MLARLFASWLGQFRNAILYIDECGVWPSFENWHLYYRLRSSYGDNRMLHEAPGHYFLEYERIS